MGTGKARILALSSSERLLGPIADLLRSAGYEVIESRSAREAVSWLRVHRADLAMIDVDACDAESPERASELVAGLRRSDSACKKALVLVRSTAEHRMRALFNEGRLTNFLAVPPDEQVDPVELTVTISKILSKDIFGFARYLGPDLNVERMEVRSSRDKPAVVDAVEAFARRVGCHPRVADGVAVAADELFTNAVYNAPTDAQGRPRFAHYARDREVSLQPGEEVSVTVAFDGRRFALAATDPFGSLCPDRVLDYLAKCFAKGCEQVDTKAGGAGLGLYYLFNLMHHFVINIAPRRSTEAICLLDVTRSYRQHMAKARSFNVFIEEV